MKLKKGDNVKIVSGKDKGKSGKIEKVLSKIGKVLVTGVNQYKRHLKSRSQGQPSEIVTITKPLPLQNVALICPHCKIQTRIGFKIEKNDKSSTFFSRSIDSRSKPRGFEKVLDKIRVCRKCDKRI